MSALYRCALFNRNIISTLKKQTGLIQWKTPSSSALSQTADLSTMANNNKSRKRSLSCTRRLSSTPEDGRARVKRVSIEGNIGKLQYFTINDWGFFVHGFVKKYSDSLLKEKYK